MVSGQQRVRTGHPERRRLRDQYGRGCGDRIEQRLVEIDYAVGLRRVRDRPGRDSSGGLRDFLLCFRQTSYGIGKVLPNAYYQRCDQRDGLHVLDVFAERGVGDGQFSMDYMMYSWGRAVEMGTRSGIF
jgi:hypothetical protein